MPMMPMMRGPDDHQINLTNLQRQLLVATMALGNVDAVRRTLNSMGQSITKEEADKAWEGLRQMVSYFD